MFLTDYLREAKSAALKWNVCTRGSVEEGLHGMALDPQSEVFGVAFSKAWSSFITKLQEKLHQNHRPYSAISLGDLVKWNWFSFFISEAIKHEAPRDEWRARPHKETEASENAFFLLHSCFLRRNACMGVRSISVQTSLATHKDCMHPETCRCNKWPLQTPDPKFIKVKEHFSYFWKTS